MVFDLPKLSFEFNELEPYIDGRTMEVHYSKHHQGYVNKLNDAVSGSEFEDMSVEDILKDINNVPQDMRQAVINNGGGHFNHSFFWTILTPNKKEISGKILEEINKKFGSVDSFKELFTEAAMKRFGSGWCWLVLDNNELSIISTANQDSPVMENKIPLIGLDVWEHAYYLKYQNRRKEYVEAFFNVLNWEEVNKRFLEALG